MVNKKGSMCYNSMRVSKEEIAMCALEDDFKGCILNGLAHNMVDGILDVMEVNTKIDEMNQYVSYTASVAILSPARYSDLLIAEDTLNKWNSVYEIKISKKRHEEMLKAEQDLRELRKIVRG